ncbi:MAG: methionine aminopeptidase [Candidatus Babeliales bacterium]
MISIKNKISVAKMERAGLLLQEVFDDISSFIKEDVSTLDIDTKIAQLLKEKNLTSKALGYRGYKHVSCISVNDVVVHGIPTASQILCEGDLVKVDICASYDGYCADMARAYFIGKPKPEVEKLVAVAESALKKGIEKARVGNRLGDISAAIQTEVEKHGFGVVRDFAGHGIGKQMHEDPEILNYGKPGQGPLLQAGMTFAIEPMITQGNYKVYVAEDGWTVKTLDKSLAAHVEDTIAITADEPKVLTRSKR